MLNAGLTPRSHDSQHFLSIHIHRVRIGKCPLLLHHTVQTTKVRQKMHCTVLPVHLVSMMRLTLRHTEGFDKQPTSGRIGHTKHGINCNALHLRLLLQTQRDRFHPPANPPSAHLLLRLFSASRGKERVIRIDGEAPLRRLSLCAQRSFQCSMRCPRSRSARVRKETGTDIMVLRCSERRRTKAIKRIIPNWMTAGQGDLA